MKVLIIEDNDIKYGLILDFLKSCFPGYELFRAGSYQSGVSNLVKNSYDRVILDMTLPVSDIGQSLVGIDVFTFGGQLILRETLRRKIDVKFVVLTQYGTFVRDQKEVTFEELRNELLEMYPSLVLGCVKLDSSSVNWKSELETLLK